jgi:hypothetical protein
MTVHSLTVLKYVRENHRADLESIFTHFKFDIPKQQLSTAIDELIHKKLIEREFEGSPYFIISDAGCKELENTPKLYLERERKRPLIHTTSQPTRETKMQRSPILERISWLVGILAGLAAIYEVIRQFFKK